LSGCVIVTGGGFRRGICADAKQSRVTQLIVDRPLDESYLDDDLGRVKALLEEGHSAEEGTPPQSEAPSTSPRRVRRKPGSKGKS